MRYKEERINLKKLSELEAEMFCPHCGKSIKQPEYKCDICQKEYVYYIPVESPV